MESIAVLGYYSQRRWRALCERAEVVSLRGWRSTAGGSCEPAVAVGAHVVRRDVSRRSRACVGFRAKRNGERVARFAA
jgi:hypothetical protein